MFSMCSEFTPRARIPDSRIPQLMQPCESVEFFGQIEMAKRIDRKTLTESIDRDISVIFDFRNLFKNIDYWILWNWFQSMFCLLMKLQRCWLCEALVAG